MMQQFDGKLAVVTGAASGIGRSTADLLVERGARVVGIDIAAPEGETPFTCLQADLLDPDDVARALGDAVGAGDRIDVLCNIAGGEPRVDRPTVWQATVDTNLTTAYVTTERAARYLGSGSAVVNVSSLVGMLIGEAPAYSAAKAGIIGLTRAYARMLARDGVRVNCVAPGVVETPGWGGDGVPEAWISLVPLGRQAFPVDIARVIAFLASDEAGYVSGSCVVVDGALSTALGPQADFATSAGGEL